MSRFHGPQFPGALRLYRQSLREQAEARQAEEWARERRKTPAA